MKPEFFSDRKLARLLSRDARLLYIAMWNQSDEHGRLQGDPRFIKGACFPYDDDLGLADIERLTKEIEAAGRLQRYDDEGDPYVFLPKLAGHQRLEPDKVPSRLPAPPLAPDPDARPDAHAGLSAPDSDGPARDADEAALLYVAGGREQVAGGRVAPDEPTRAARKPDEIWDALLAACSVDNSSVTQSSRGAYNKAVADLRSVEATPPEIHRRATVFRARWPDASLTPTALARRWAECDTAPRAGPPPTHNAQVIASARREAQDAETQQRRALP